MRLDSELDRLGSVDGEGVRLELANRRDPDEAMLPRLGSGRGLLHDNFGAAVGEGVQGCLVVGAVVQDSGRSDDAIESPHGGGQEGDDESPVGHLWLMQADGDESHDPRANMNHIKNLVPDTAEECG